MKTRLIITTFLITLFSSISYADDVLEFNITGSIASSTCYIKTKNQTVNLGTWLTQSTSGIGSGINSLSDKVEFSLDFDCPQGLTVNAQLQGNQYSPSNIYYIDIEKGDKSAEGIVIETHFYRDKWLSLVYGDVRTLINKTVEGTNSVKLRAFYRQISSTIKPGTANSNVTIDISYE